MMLHDFRLKIEEEELFKKYSELGKGLLHRMQDMQK